ncbi:hypothetical protein F2P56_028190 [Juglans regia]|uniref:Defective in cullin neddylation protein n=2 Tax=Juglans regia TaxID=51240 RepID=A0A2I4DV65_JUGRE|nr:DCN1-like protein 5 isoform X1 [Juglans regia]KAF5453276.1 hypothetical protein F2P56_028190 [Juglans regia]
MRRSASRKTGQPNSTSSANSLPTDIFRSASSKATSKELERIDNLFHSYANRSSGMIDPEGIETLCSDMEVDHTDVRILMLAWKMKAEKQGYFILEEWRRGLKALRADTINKLKKALPELEKEVKRPSTFLDFYSYAFRYCLTEEKQKSIDIESICELLDLVLGSQFHAQVDLFIQYLKDLNTGKKIGTGHRDGGLYYLDVKQSPTRALTSSSSSTFEWHCHLGHLSLSLLKRQVRNIGNVSSFPYAACQLSKHHRVFCTSS